MSADLARQEHTVGRYVLFGEIGAGGMAVVHLGRLIGPAGFSRLVAIKRLHPNLGKEREFVNAFLDEARIAARVNHPNVVSIHDVVIDGDEVLLVMDYVHGRALSQLLSNEYSHGRKTPPDIACAIGVDMLHGLHAAHSARDERGRPLGLVHRDVSPQNVLVGADGTARVLDFGIAKALGRLHTTTNGAVKGKLAYMSPERLLEHDTTLSADIYAAGIVIWEMLAGERYFGGASDPTLIPKVIASTYRHLSDPKLAALDAMLEVALSRDPHGRYASAAEFVAAIEAAVDIASRGEVASWVEKVAGEELRASAEAIEAIERSSLPSFAVAAPSAVHATPARETTSLGPPASPTRMDVTQPLPLTSMGAGPQREEPYTNSAVVKPTQSDESLPDAARDRGESTAPRGIAGPRRNGTLAFVSAGVVVALATAGILRTGQPSAGATSSLPPAATTQPGAMPSPESKPSTTVAITPPIVSSSPSLAASGAVPGRPFIKPLVAKTPAQSGLDAGQSTHPSPDGGKSSDEAPSDRK